MDKKYILFDLDGTLTDSSEGIINCVRYALKAFDKDNLDYATLLRFIGPPLIDAFAEYANMALLKFVVGVNKLRELCINMQFCVFLGYFLHSGFINILYLINWIFILYPIGYFL